MKAALTLSRSSGWIMSSTLRPIRPTGVTPRRTSAAGLAERISPLWFTTAITSLEFATSLRNRSSLVRNGRKARSTARSSRLRQVRSPVTSATRSAAANSPTAPRATASLIAPRHKGAGVGAFRLTQSNIRRP